MMEELERPFVQFAKHNTTTSLTTPAKLNNVVEKGEKVISKAISIIGTPDRVTSTPNNVIGTPTITRVLSCSTPDGKGSTVCEDDFRTPEKFSSGTNADSGFSTPGSKRKRNSVNQSLEGRKRTRIEIEDEFRLNLPLNIPTLDAGEITNRNRFAISYTISNY